MRPKPLAPERATQSSADSLAGPADRLAHEFNNHLTTILGYANLLARSLDAHDPRRADAEEIIAGAHRASGLIRELKAWGRATSLATGADPSEPVATGRAGPAGSVATSMTGARTARPPVILVVDDERSVRYLVRTILTRAGYEVADAPSADAADAWLSAYEGPVGLLVSDIALPESSGPDLVHRLRVHRPDLKVLFISGYSTDHVRADPRIDPATPFVQKPFSAEALTEQVRRMLL